MVSHLTRIGRNLAVMLLIFSLASLWLAPSPVFAKNPYIERDGHEGDPGDGVLNPNPQVDPDPTPSPKGPVMFVFHVTMVDMGGGNIVPVFQLRSETLNYAANSWSRAVPPLTFEGRWHRAP